MLNNCRIIVISRAVAKIENEWGVGGVLKKGEGIEYEKRDAVGGEGRH